MNRIILLILIVFLVGCPSSNKNGNHNRIHDLTGPSPIEEGPCKENINGDILCVGIFLGAEDLGENTIGNREVKAKIKVEKVDGSFVVYEFHNHDRHAYFNDLIDINIGTRIEAFISAKFADGKRWLISYREI